MKENICFLRLDLTQLKGAYFFQEFKREVIKYEKIYKKINHGIDSDRVLPCNLCTGWRNFKWVFTANHKTDYFKFYITKEGWNPNQKLVISDFDKIPLQCDAPVPEWKAPEQPPRTGLSFDCRLPERTGYQVIMAVWKVNDTVNSFYNLIDVKYPGDIQPPTDSYPNNIGSIKANKTLTVGDQILFTTHKTSGASETRKLLTIHHNDEGEPATWPYNLATSINNTYNGELKAGIKGNEADGYPIKPVRGDNNIYVKKNSDYKSVEISFDHGDIEEDVAELVNLQSEYPSTKGNPVPIRFAIASKTNNKVNAVIEITTHEGATVKTIMAHVMPGETKPINFMLDSVTKREMYHIKIQYFINDELKEEEYGMFYVKAPQDVGGTFKTKLIGSIQYYQVDNTQKPPKNIIARNWYVTYNLGDLNLSNNPITVNAWNNGFNLAKAIKCPYPRSSNSEITYEITGTLNKIECKEITA